MNAILQLLVGGSMGGTASCRHYHFTDSDRDIHGQACEQGIALAGTDSRSEGFYPNL